MKTTIQPRIKQQLTISLPKEHWTEIEDFAFDNGMNVEFAASSMIEAVLEEWIDRAHMMDQLTNEPS